MAYNTIKIIYILNIYRENEFSENSKNKKKFYVVSD